VRFKTHLLGNTTKHQLLPIDLLAAVNPLCAPPIPAVLADCESTMSALE
jgi:hypothetical protein